MGSCASPTSCWANLASSVAVPIPQTTLNLCRVSCKTTLRFNRKFTTAAHTFHATSTSPIPRYYPFPFGMRTIAAHASSAGGVSSQTSAVIISPRAPTVFSPNPSRALTFVATPSSLLHAFPTPPRSAYLHPLY